MADEFDSSGFGGDIRRAVTDFKKIEDIDEDDIRVSIIGTLVSVEDDTIVVDDGSGNLEVSLLEMENPAQLENLETGQIVRVVGKLGRGDELEMRGEAVQDFSKFDLKIYEKAKKLTGFGD
ncbi:MAG: OB-fold nucleic acid binding domain-containing protein [Candidatus Aenigmatarchaeota archaeon]